MLSRIALMDERAIGWSNKLRGSVLTAIMRLLTHSGSGFVWFGLTIVFISLYESGLEAVPDLLTLISCMFGAFLSLISGQLLKRIFNRPRPAAALSWHKALVATPADGSFPSTHTSTAAALALGLAISGHFLAPFAAVWSLGVAFSRYYLGVHYPSDIVAGALLGFVFGFWDYRCFVAAVL